MDQSTGPIRDQLAGILDWEEAHVGFDKAVDGIPPDKRGARAPGFDHSPWQLSSTSGSHKTTFSISA